MSDRIILSKLVHHSNACSPISVILFGNVTFIKLSQPLNIESPIVFQGGVSKNIGVVKAFEDITGHKIYVDKNSHLMGAFGIAIMARESKIENVFNFDIDNLKLETRVNQCGRCSNNCEIVMVYRNDELLDFWGNHCEKGSILKNV